MVMECACRGELTQSAVKELNIQYSAATALLAVSNAYRSIGRWQAADVWRDSAVTEARRLAELIDSSVDAVAGPDAAVSEVAEGYLAVTSAIENYEPGRLEPLFGG